MGAYLSMLSLTGASVFEVDRLRVSYGFKLDFLRSGQRITGGGIWGGGNIISGSSSPTSVLTTFSKAVSSLPYVSFTIFGELICGVDPRVSSCESNFGSDLLNCIIAFATSSGGGARFWLLFLFCKCVDGGGGGGAILRSCLRAYDIFCFSLEPTGGGGGGGCKPLLL